MPDYHVAMRRRLALLVFAALSLHQIDRPMLSLPFVDRAPVQARYESLADAAWYPDYPRFLAEVAARTQPGDSIAVLVPAPQWDPGYSYAYYRASYFLAGREVLPLISRENRFIVENFRRAQYIAVWHNPLPRGRVVWSGHGGTLVRRR
jgi:hypothetical protein